MTITRPRAFALLLTVFAAVLTVLPAAPSSARGTAVPYLALGDSLPYGYDVVTQIPGLDDVGPDQHIGYPETLAKRSPLDVTNASCPGETSGSFIRVDEDDNGCDSWRGLFDINVDWANGTQLEFAEAFLDENPDTGLVSIQLGANDLFICQAGDDGCSVPEFFGVLTAISNNLGESLTRLRLAEYDGPIVLVGYYALDYGDPTQVFLAEQSLMVLEGLAASGAFGDVVVADGFAAFEQASRRSGGSPFEAGLLLPPAPNAEPGTEYDVHTTPRGDRVMAQAVRKAIDLGSIVSTARSGR